MTVKEFLKSNMIFSCKTVIYRMIVLGICVQDELFVGSSNSKMIENFGNKKYIESEIDCNQKDYISFTIVCE